MKDQFSISNSQDHLKRFIFDKHLMNSNSVVDFNANITIDTSKNKLEIRSRVFVTFEGNHSGKLSILSESIKPRQYPTEFIVEYQNFEYVEDIFLKITGIHTENSEIGEYVIKIYNPISSF